MNDDERELGEPRTLAEALDRDLSALSERRAAELDREHSDALAQRLALDPEAARRLASFETLNTALRDLEAPPLPADLRARLDAKITESSRPTRGFDVTTTSSPARRARFGVTRVAFAIAAACVAIWWLAGLDAPIPDPVTVAISTDPPQNRSTPVDDAEQIDPLSTAVTPALEFAAGDVTDDAPAWSPIDPEWEAADVPVEDIEIALDYETLRDFEVIRDLELIEALVAMREAERS